MTASGKPRIVREQLKKHHLLEMPEKWNQIATDDHVHDVNTKGRKSPTHLIMDAWIKGIRRLKVVYYNYLAPDAASELLEAADVMKIRVRIGIEFNPRFRDRYIQLIWAPRGLFSTGDYLHFLEEPGFVEFTAESAKVSEYRRSYVLKVLGEFNRRHIKDIKRNYGLDIEPLGEKEFLSFVGAGQVSILHLAEFIHAKVFPAMAARTEELRESYTGAEGQEKERIADLVEEMNSLDSEAIVEKYLRPSRNPGIADPGVPSDNADVPDFLRISPREMVRKLDSLHSACSITLGLSDMKIEDVIEILYDCQGMITHLENFNLKDFVTGRNPDYEEINELQRAINSGNVIELKRIIRACIERLKRSEHGDNSDRTQKLIKILHDIDTFQSYYKGTLLKSRVGSDSTGRSHHLYGMGMVIKDTLPKRVRREVERGDMDMQPWIPVYTGVYLRVSYLPRDIESPLLETLYSALRHVPGLRFIGCERHEEWEMLRHSTLIGEQGNVITLGGIDQEKTNNLSIRPMQAAGDEGGISWRYLNSSLKNWIKVLIGFIPAFLTFFLTKDWWLLAYFGAVIWFGITGLRNIIQSVLGGGGISRTSLLKWNDYVSWERLTDSLLFTGFSVPLLDYFIKTVIMDNLFGITVATGPVLLYSVMALANGIYISTHNAFRGFQRAVVFGNLFRTVLSIPIAVAFNIIAGGILSIFGVTGVEMVLQKWAAIISKAASDCVAGVIEGLADRYQNIRIRIRDYRSKLEQLFSTYTQMEILFPESDVLEMLESPGELIFTIQKEAGALEDIFIINALDLLYFWMYQPRAQSALKTIMKTMSDEERAIFIRSQSVLERNREISQLFLDGIVGRNFTRALAFYLGSSENYLKTLKRMM